MTDLESDSSTPQGTGSAGALRGLLVRLALVLAMVAAGTGLVWLVRTAHPAAGPAGPDIPARQGAAAGVQPGAAVPGADPAGPDARPAAQGRVSGVDPLREWAERMATSTGIPARALLAYGNAELVLRSTSPGCRLSWPTLAGIGRIESDHGRYGGASLGADGRPSPPIVGVPLDGSPGLRAIADSDGGRLDGDPAVDRAVGPMQFIPSTWRAWASDGDLDGLGDPQQIDDAALAAARYLCAGGRDLSTPAGWWAGVLSYNDSVSYGQKVFGLAESYGRA